LGVERVYVRRRLEAQVWAALRRQESVGAGGEARVWSLAAGRLAVAAMPWARR
jgi:hypothetical protein